MSNPIVELISDDIYDAINEITVANGFNQTLIAYRPKRDDIGDVVPEDLKVLVIQGDEEDGEITMQVGMWKEWQQPYVIMALVIDSDSSTDPIDTRKNQVRADIQKKLMVDPSRGGYAIDTTILPSESIPENDKGWTGINVYVVVKYRTKIDDPYTQV